MLGTKVFPDGTLAGAGHSLSPLGIGPQNCVKAPSGETGVAKAVLPAFSSASVLERNGCLASIPELDDAIEPDVQDEVAEPQAGKPEEVEIEVS